MYALSDRRLLGDPELRTNRLPSQAHVFLCPRGATTGNPTSNVIPIVETRKSKVGQKVLKIWSLSGILRSQLRAFKRGADLLEEQCLSSWQAGNDCNGSHEIGVLAPISRSE